MSQLRTLQVQGNPYEIGSQHGQAFADEIRHLTAERLRLSQDPHWTGRRLALTEVLALGEACLAAHQAYAPELVTELEGMAAATGLGVTELLIMNGFTDFVDAVYNYGLATETAVSPAADNCTAFLAPNQATADGCAFLGQTWDMHATATPYVLLLRGCPHDGPAFLTFTITGCVGMIGMNAAGIAVGINNLLGGDGRPGVTWPFVVRKVLAQTNLEDALACITGAPLAGAHNYLLLDKNGRGYNVEAMSTSCRVAPLQETCLVHTNHCTTPAHLALTRPRLPESEQSSQSRLSRAAELLAERPVTPETLMALTRDRTAVNGICVLAEPPFYVETCGAVIMRPASGDFWAVWGLPTENEYEHFVI